MAANVGDTILMRAKTKRVSPGARRGVIEEVLDASQPRLVVRWDDGRQTVITPMPDAFRIEPAKAKRAPAKPAARAKAPAAAKAAATKKESAKPTAKPAVRRKRA